ncbi:MAG: 50S ribosomal protein L4 [Fervidicoccaceae archaeon]|jgi:large subunit ribosomal protein L4e
MVVLIKYIPREVEVFSASGESKDKIALPPVFHIPVRKDLIRRAFLSEFTASLQPKGRDPMAGKRTPAESLGVGRGLARVPRIPGTSIGALANMTVGGRIAHPPRVEEKLHEEINRKEKKLATASALAATSYTKLVAARGHLFDSANLPVLIEDEVEKEITRAVLARELLKKLGLWKDVERAYEKTRIRAGKGKMRGRRYVEPKSILFILSSTKSPMSMAVRNLPGVDVVTAKEVSVLHLAPGGVPGRLTVISRGALEELNNRFKELVVVRSE